jgi:hypothetical protein
MSATIIAYYRVSTDGQGKSGLGLEAQRDAVIRFAGGEGLYQSAEVLTLWGSSQIRGSMIQHGNWRSCHGPADRGSNGFFSG